MRDNGETNDREEKKRMKEGKLVIIEANGNGKLVRGFSQHYCIANKRYNLFLHYNSCMICFFIPAAVLFPVICVSFPVFDTTHTGGVK